MKKTVVIGASTNPQRYAYLATQRLQQKGIPVVPVGLREGDINGEKILTGFPEIEGVHTVTLYVGPKHQEHWLDYVIKLNPKRVIFNPGTENAEVEQAIENKQIEVLHACTLVLLSTNNY